MVQTTRTFRIFVSSTFSDLKVERNALHKFVFPRLRDLCIQYSCRFQAIDLRWGVREEAGLDQQTMKICLDEIVRCQTISPRPNFIVLLGDRYGSRPLPAEIPEAEFRQIESTITDVEERSLLYTWYRRDENALSPVYCLQPRLRESEFEDLNTWETKVERPLRRAFIAADEGLGSKKLVVDWSLKYGASATEQEISAGALNVANAAEHVSCYSRSIRNLPQDAGAKDFVDLDENDKPNKAMAAKLRDLNLRLEAHLLGNVHHYQADWIGRVTPNLEPIYQRCQSVMNLLTRKIIDLTTENRNTEPDPEVWKHLSQLVEETFEDPLSNEIDSGPSETESPITLVHIPNLCADVYLVLARIILSEILQFQQKNPLVREISDHEEFGKNRALLFVGRKSILKVIHDYLAGEDRHPLAVWGESGSGKSALMAKAIDDCRLTMPKCLIVSRFIGATPASSDGRSVLESICRQVTQMYDGDEETIPTSYTELVKELPLRLALATSQKPLVVFIDAVDQLSNADQARNLNWLPRELPQHVRLVVSTSPGECKTILERKLVPENLLELEAMTSKEGSSLLDVWLKNASRTLQSSQKEEVLRKFATSAGSTRKSRRAKEKGGLPLYLKLAFEEARRWKSYTPARDLAPDISGIIRQLFERLSQDANHGRVVVSRCLGYLAAAKNGLSEDELLDLLSRDEDVLKDFKARSKHTPPEERLPVIVWSRLFFDLEPYLTERSADGESLLTFYHRQLREVAEQLFLAGDQKQKCHAQLADYFSSQQLFEKEKGTPNIRKLSELPYQQTHARQWDQLYATLTDFEFLEAKCMHASAIISGKGENARTVYGGVYELQEDYRRALEEFPAS